MTNHIRKTRLLLLFSLMLCLALSLSTPACAEGNDGPVSALSTEGLFTSRDLEQKADLTEAEVITLSTGEDIRITAKGVYVLRGSAENVTVFVEAGDDDKVQLVLDGADIKNADFPCIYVRTADKVFLTTSADSSLSVTGPFVRDEGSKVNGAVFSRSDLTLNGTAALKITSTANGVVSKDDLKVTGGSYEISADSKALQANDSIRIAGGSFVLDAGSDALHAENSKDDTLGYIYISSGDLSIKAGDDGIHGNAIIQIDGGNLAIAAAEGIEGTYIQINGGNIAITSWEDGINGAHKSRSYQPTVEINGGSISIAMGPGDTDGIDCNGDLIITGGSVEVSGNGSGIDYEGTGRFTGGTLIVNGQELSSLPEPSKH